MTFDNRPRSCETADANYFPGPMTLQEARRVRVRSLVFELLCAGQRIFVAKTAECAGVRGEGRTVEAALLALKEELLVVVRGRNGGLFPESSSREFQEEYFQRIVAFWGKGGVQVASVTEGDFALFGH